MAKKQSGSLARGKRTKRKGRSTLAKYDSDSLLRFFLKEDVEKYEVADHEINYSDIPELTSTQMKRAKRAKVGRPPMGVAARKMISIKIDPLLLQATKKRARKEGKGYQTLIHEILEKYVHQS